MRGTSIQHAFVGFALLGALATHARARPFEGLSRRDQMSLLYKPQFQFTSTGEPLVNVGLSINGRQATFSGPRGVRLLPAGEDGVELPARPGEKLRVRVAKATPARMAYWAAVRVAGAKAQRTASALERWRGRGFEPRHFDTGGVVGLEQRVLDNRVTLIGVQRHKTRAAAKKAAARIGKTHKAQLHVHEELGDPPTGVLEVLGEGGEVRARVRDLVWVVASQGEVVELDGASYRGTLYATLDAKGRLAVANSVPVEKMLYGLVPAEIFPRAPLEALKAQAVTARGEVLAKVGTRHFGEPFRVCAKQHCQVYKGHSRELPRTSRAVKETRGEVLWGDGRLIDTVYSASCGGHTEHNDVVWESTADRHLRGRQDGASTPGDLSDEPTLRRFLAQDTGAHCARIRIGKTSRYRWTRRFGQSELRRLLRKRANLGAVRAIEVLGRGVSGRVTGVRVIGAKDTLLVKREYPVRQLFGGLFSGMFVVDAEAPGEDGLPSGFVLRGGGWGHGVGMCQTGAMGMAEEGHNFRRILRHYYQGGSVQKLY